MALKDWKKIKSRTSIRNVNTWQHKQRNWKIFADRTVFNDKNKKWIVGTNNWNNSGVKQTFFKSKAPAFAFVKRVMRKN